MKRYILTKEDILENVVSATHCRITALKFDSTREFRVKAIMTKDGKKIRYIQIRCTKRTPAYFLRTLGFERYKIEFLINDEWIEFVIGEEPVAEKNTSQFSGVFPSGNPLALARETVPNFMELVDCQDDFFITGPNVRGPPCLIK